VNLLVWVVRPIEEWRFANTLFHVGFLDLKPIRVAISVTGSESCLEGVNGQAKKISTKTRNELGKTGFNRCQNRFHRFARAQLKNEI
jgi:hypothetical protein